MIQDSFEAYLKSRGPYLGDPKCFSYSYDDLQEAFKAGYKAGNGYSEVIVELGDFFDEIEST